MNEPLFEWLKQDITEIKHEMNLMKKDVSSLLAMKWQIIGGAFATSVLLTVLFNIVVTFFKK